MAGPTEREFSAPPPREGGFLPLRGYALIGDGRTCALVGADGAVDWWALPTMNAVPTFGALLDPERGGRLTLRPAGEYRTRRQYEGAGGVLVTEFRTDTGAVRVTDALNLGAGSLLPWTELARRVEGIEGEVEMSWTIVPGDRFSTAAPYARVFDGVPLVTVADQTLALVVDKAGDAKQADGGFSATFTASEGTTSLLAVAVTNGEPTSVPPADAVLRRVAETAAHWSEWVDLVEYNGAWRDAVVRSALVHKQLTLARSGGLQAAATTSLPEDIGGAKNYDYRFSWVRDTAFALNALTTLGLRGEVHGVISYLLRSVRETAPDVRVFYTMDGEVAGADMEQVTLWRGYRDSTPVQVGNSAASQRQLGAYGDLMESLLRYAQQGNILDAATAQIVLQVADRVCDQWTQDDAGLWELSSYRPYTSSKIGCWAALDRAIQLAESGQVPDAQTARWRDTASAIRAFVDDACWSPTKNSYTFYAGTEDLDCATLLAARTGFVRGDDARLNGTIDTIRRELSAGGPLLLRYSGMRGQEGAFIACSFWLVEALVQAGRLDEARQTMDDMVALCNDVGLLSEQIDPDGHALLGNMPQALSHLALISAASAYQRAAGRR